MVILIYSQHPPGDDQYGYEESGERWLPIHTVESIVSHTRVPDSRIQAFPTQLLSVISLLSSDHPNTDSPANVDAAKEVRNDPEGDTIVHDSL